MHRTEWHALTIRPQLVVTMKERGEETAMESFTQRPLYESERNTESRDGYGNPNSLRHACGFRWKLRSLELGST